jgi:hypothetical protein
MDARAARPSLPARCGRSFGAEDARDRPDATTRRPQSAIRPLSAAVRPRAAGSRQVLGIQIAVWRCPLQIKPPPPVLQLA